MSDNKKAPEQMPENEKVKIPSASKLKLIKLIIALLLIVFVTNPSRIPFLPADLKESMTNGVNSLFNNISSVSNVVTFNWIVLFQLLVMLLMLTIIYEVAKMVLGALKPKSNRAKTMVHILSSILNYLAVIVAVFWALSIVGVDVATLFAGLGILALIIGFGAESLVADLVTGLFILMENEYNVGDIIEVNGYRGTVSSIGIRTTSITDGGGNTKIINNSELRNIINLSDKASRAICDFAIPYEVKISKAEEKLDQVLTAIQAKYPEIFPVKPEYLGVQELGESAVVLRIVAEVNESNRFKAARLLNRELKESMEELGIACPYNQLVIHQGQ